MTQHVVQKRSKTLPKPLGFFVILSCCVMMYCISVLWVRKVLYFCSSCTRMLETSVSWKDWAKPQFREYHLQPFENSGRVFKSGTIWTSSGLWHYPRYYFPMLYYSQKSGHFKLVARGIKVISSKTEIHPLVHLRRFDDNEASLSS